ncbi:MAG: M23 family metallopeptidase [Deltaproteobacteria bacterium]|nr:M23 family metallopeptidase [Deltaproteobacteria bacterium]
MIILLASAVIFFDYVNVKKKEIDLVSLKEKTKIQNVQLQTFADKINDMEAELSRLRSLDTKIRVLTNTNNEEPGVKSRRLSLGGQGGPEPVQLSFNNEASLAEMVSRLDRMNFEIKSQEKSLHELHASIQDQESILVATPSIWPANGYVSSGFGYRESPFGSNYEFHDGLDISAPSGAPVLATADGVVTLTGNYGDTGNTIIISHGYGYETGYCHLSYIGVEKGQRIERGQEIGRVGSTGRSTGPHLHYLVKIAGSKVNPRNYLN